MILFHKNIFGEPGLLSVFVILRYCFSGVLLMSERSDLHQGHRTRMLDRFLKNGIDDFEEHEVLEIILFSIIPRCNTNEISHKLIDKFGSISGVLSSSKNDLMKISGIGDNAAAFLCFLGEFVHKYRLKRFETRNQLNSLGKTVEYARTLITDPAEEMSFVIILDKSLYIIGSEKIFDGEINKSYLDARAIVSAAMNKNSQNIVLVHNHPYGVLNFSSADISATRNLLDVLRPLGIELNDHILIMKDRFCSMRSSGIFSEYWT